MKQPMQKLPELARLVQHKTALHERAKKTRHLRRSSRQHRHAKQEIDTGKRAARA